MKKRTFLALFLAVMLVLPCLSLTVSASMEIYDNGKATGSNWIAYANEAVVPTIDGNATEKVWASTNTIDGITALWSDTGFYFKTALNAEFTYADINEDTVKAVVVVNGVVAGLPAGSDYFAGAECVEIYVPYTYNFIWENYNFKQYRVSGPAGLNYTPSVVEYTKADGTTGSQTFAIATEYSAVTYDWITQASDLIGNIMNINGKKIQMAGPYGYNYIMNGFTEWDDDDNQLSGQSAMLSFTVNEDNQNMLDPWGNPIATYVDPNDKNADGSAVIRAPYCYDPNGNPLPKLGWLPAELSYAVKVNDNTAPLIDGVIDDVWETTGKAGIINKYQEIGVDAYGYLSFLWDEEGMYILCYIYDPNPTFAVDEMGYDHPFVVFSETTTQHDNVEGDNALPAEMNNMNARGSYAFGFSPAGTLVDTSGAFAQAYNAENHSGIVAASAASKDGYVQEIYVPYFTLNKAGSEFKAEIGHLASYQCCLDNWLPGGSSRYSNGNMGSMSSYWSNPQSTFDLVFVGEYDVGKSELTSSAVYDMINGLLTPYLKQVDALDAATVNGMIMEFTDSLENTDVELAAALAELQTQLDAAVAAGEKALTEAQVKEMIKNLATKDAVTSVSGEVDEKIANIKTANYTPVIVILFVLVVVEAGAIAFLFIKKKG